MNFSNRPFNTMRRHSPTLPWFRRHLRVPVTGLLLATFSLWSARVDGATLTWDPDAVVGAPYGGVGTWDTSASVWDNAGVLQAWNNGSLDTALFGGTVGTVTLGAPITAGGLIFNSNGYSVTGDTLTLATPGRCSGTCDQRGVLRAGEDCLGDCWHGRPAQDRQRNLVPHQYEQQLHRGHRDQWVGPL